MVTHRWWGNKFCKKACKNAHRRENHHTQSGWVIPRFFTFAGGRQERQAAQPRQREPPLQPLRGDPLRRAPAQRPKGVTAFSRAEWARSLALAERSARRWRKEQYVEAIEILEARQSTS